MHQVKLDAVGVIVTVNLDEETGAVTMFDTFGRRWHMSCAEARQLGDALIAAAAQQ